MIDQICFPFIWLDVTLCRDSIHCPFESGLSPLIRCAIGSRNKSLVKSVDYMAPKPIPNNPIVPQPVKALGQWNRGSTLDRAKKATDMGL